MRIHQQIEEHVYFDLVTMLETTAWRSRSVYQDYMEGGFVTTATISGTPRGCAHFNLSSAASLWPSHSLAITWTDSLLRWSLPPVYTLGWYPFPRCVGWLFDLLLGLTAQQGDKIYIAMFYKLGSCTYIWRQFSFPLARCQEGPVVGRGKWTLVEGGLCPIAGGNGGSRFCNHNNWTSPTTMQFGSRPFSKLQMRFCVAV